MPRIVYTPAQLQSLPPKIIEESVAIVVDQLRATSSIVTAMAHGATNLLAVSSLTIARAYRALHPEVLLAGERNGTKPEGFDFGNSPREFTPEKIRDRQIVLTTTNGTGALLGCRGARKVWIASLLNLDAVIRLVRSLEPSQPLLLVAAGTGMDFSLEDTLVLAEVLHAIQPTHPLASLRSLASAGYSTLLARTKNGRRLLSLGLRDDIEFCSELNKFNVVPQCRFETFQNNPVARIYPDET